MAEVLVRDAVEFAKEKAMILRLGLENEKLNRGLEAMRASNELLTAENDALRRELEEERERAKDARKRSARIYRDRIVEQANAKPNGKARRWEGLFLMLLGALIMAGIILWIFRPVY